MRHTGKLGFSLVEVTMVMAIFVTVMAITLDVIATSQGYSAFGRAQDDLVEESDAAADAIAQDLSSAGWHFESNPLDDTTSPPTTLTYSAASKVNDRTKLRYYPYVQIPNSVPATRFTHTHRAANLVTLNHPPAWDAYLPGTAADVTRDYDQTSAAERQEWRDSFYARSHEIIFVKATVAVWDHVHDKMMLDRDRQPTLFFGGTSHDWRTRESVATAEEAKRQRLRILYTSGWSPQYSGTDIIGYSPRTVYYYGANTAGDSVGNANTIPYGVVMESGYFPDFADLSVIKPNWHTLNGSAYVETDQTDLNNLLEFGYAVIPSKIGAGCLVRLRRESGVTVTTSRFPEPGMAISESGGTGMVIDRVISDHVTRVVFDTYRTVDEGAGVVTSLAINHVRVRIYFARPGPTGAVISRVVERVVTMKSQNNARDKDIDQADSNASKLGDRPIGIDY